LQLFIFPISLFLMGEIKILLNRNRTTKNILKIMYILILKKISVLRLSISAFNLCIIAEVYVSIVLYEFLNLTAMINALDVRHNHVKPAIILYASMLFNLRIGEVLLELKGGIFSTRGHDIHNQNYHTAIMSITCKSDVVRVFFIKLVICLYSSLELCVF